MEGGVDVEEFPRPDIKCCQYLSSMATCAHVLSTPVLSTTGMMRRRLWTMDFCSCEIHLHVVSCG